MSSAAPLNYRTPVPSHSPPLVALAAWLVPGGGYWVIGDRARGLLAGVTIVLTFVLGLLIGGVRIIQVPTFDEQGQRVPGRGLLREGGAKPWSVTQVLVGPLGIAGGAASVWASKPQGGGEPPGTVSHGRVNEIAVLYTAVAGMLNLLTIIDSAYRAAHPEPRPQPNPQANPVPRPVPPPPVRR